MARAGRHVCMVVHSYYPVGEVRGEREARAAVEEGYAVTVVCLRRRHEPERETIDGVDIVRLPIQHERGADALRTIREYIAFTLRASLALLRIRRRSPIDVVYVHAPPDFLIVSGLIPRLMGSRVVLDIHDLSPHMFNMRFGSRRLSHFVERVLYGVERAACAVADRVITVHKPYRDELVAHGVRRDKISVVMNAPLPEPVTRARATASQRRPTSFVVAYHGTITDWYGVDLMVEAIARLQDCLPDLRGLILGEGDALPQVQTLAEKLGVASRIEFPTELVSQAEAISRVAGASCGVIPNRPSPLNRFALSSKLLEYVSLGVPVVVSRLHTLEAHFGPDEVTFFRAGDASSLAQAIKSVAEDPDGALAKAARAMKRAEAYSWEASRSTLLGVLASLD